MVRQAHHKAPFILSEIEGYPTTKSLRQSGAFRLDQRDLLVFQHQLVFKARQQFTLFNECFFFKKVLGVISYININ